MQDMEGRVSEADKRANTLASEKRQLESTRLRLEAEAEAERARFENEKARYDRKIADLESAYEKLKGNRDSISTSDDTLVTERSMGNSLEIRGDAFAMGALDIRSDAYDDKVPSSPQLWIASEPTAQPLAPEDKGEDKLRGSQGGMDQERVARVLHQLALECDKQSTLGRNIDLRATAPSQLLPPIAAATSLRSTLNGFPAPTSAARSQFCGADQEQGSSTPSAGVDRASTPPPALSLLSAGAPAPEHGLSRVSSSGDGGDAAGILHAPSPGQPRVLSTRRSLRMHDDDTPRTPRDSGGHRAAHDSTHLEAKPEASGAARAAMSVEDIFSNGVANRRHTSAAAAAASAAAFSSPSKPKGRSLGLQLDGTRVVRVVRGSPAHQAGTRPDDCIRTVNGIRVLKEDVGKILRMQVSPKICLCVDAEF